MRGISGNEILNVCKIQIMYDNLKFLELSVELPLEDKKFISLQQQDPKIWELCEKVKKGMYHEFYLVKNNVLFTSIVDNGHKFKARVIPDSLVDVVAPSGPQPVWTQSILEDICSNHTCLYYWKGMRAILQILAILQKLQGLCTTKGTEDTV